MARKNTQNAVTAWINGTSYRARGRRGSPISTAGGELFSYNKMIGKFSDVSDRVVIINTERYSRTTTCQQNGVVALMHNRGYEVILCASEDMFRKVNR